MLEACHADAGGVPRRYRRCASLPPGYVNLYSDSSLSLSLSDPSFSLSLSLSHTLSLSGCSRPAMLVSEVFGIISNTLVRASQSPSGPAGGASDGYGLGRGAAGSDRLCTTTAAGALRVRLGRIHPYVRSCSARVSPPNSKAQVLPPVPIGNGVTGGSGIGAEWMRGRN